MLAVSNSVMPRSIALWITFREDSRSVRWPKLLQPRPTAETRRPEPPRLRICMDRSCGMGRGDERHCGPRHFTPQAAARPAAALGSHAAQKDAAPVRTRRLTGAAWGRVIRDGGP